MYEKSDYRKAAEGAREACAEMIREKAEGDGPYSVDDAAAILKLLRHSPTDAMLMIAMRLNEIYAEGLLDAAKICEGHKDAN